jgi:hypothetical protein
VRKVVDDVWECGKMAVSEKQHTQHTDMNATSILANELLKLSETESDHQSSEAKRIILGLEACGYVFRDRGHDYVEIYGLDALMQFACSILDNEKN